VPPSEWFHRHIRRLNARSFPRGNPGVWASVRQITIVLASLPLFAITYNKGSTHPRLCTPARGAIIELHQGRQSQTSLCAPRCAGFGPTVSVRNSGSRHYQHITNTSPTKESVTLPTEVNLFRLSIRGRHMQMLAKLICCLCRTSVMTSSEGCSLASSYAARPMDLCSLVQPDHVCVILGARSGNRPYKTRSLHFNMRHDDAGSM
jgi:hypothetical protein